MTEKEITRIVLKTLRLVDKEQRDNHIENFTIAVSKKRLKDWVGRKHLTPITRSVSRKFKCWATLYWVEYYGWVNISISNIKHKYVNDAKALIREKLKPKLRIRINA